MGPDGKTLLYGLFRGTNGQSKNNSNRSPNTSRQQTLGNDDNGNNRSRIKALRDDGKKQGRYKKVILNLVQDLPIVLLVFSVIFIFNNP